MIGAEIYLLSYLAGTVIAASTISEKFFNIGGNSFRMAAMVWIENERVYVLKLMTHAEYDKEKF